MAYQPKIVAGTVTGTGWPIDGRLLYFTLWDYDNYESYHLYGWDDEHDEAVMQTIFTTETAAGICAHDTLEAFAEVWKAKKWEPQGQFVLPLDKLEGVEVKQEEIKDERREKLKSFGFDLAPRKDTDKGGIVCLPLDKNLNGDVQKNHPDWKAVECPRCGKKCWEAPEVEKLRAQGAQALCTECAISAGLVQPFRPAGNSQGNRATRRKANRERRRNHGR